jgi:hypothetical protein
MWHYISKRSILKQKYHINEHSGNSMYHIFEGVARFCGKSWGSTALFIILVVHKGKDFLFQNY